MTDFWDSQVKTVEKLSNVLRLWHKRPVVVSPTGSGKTKVASYIIRKCIDHHKSVLFLAPRRELVYQAQSAFLEYGVEAGIVMAGEPTDSYKRVQIASFDTLHARGIRKTRMIMPTADFVIVDEAHLSMAPAKLEVLEHYSDKIIIGLTATPARGDGTGLGKFYDSIVNETSVRELIDDGVLVEPEYYAPTEYDLKNVKSTKSDYIIKHLEKVVDQPKLIGDIYENWKRIAPTKRTVIFCTTRKHSRHVRDLFVDSGIVAEHVDGETELHERKEIFDRVRSGETQVLCNVYVASYGLDIPPLECCVLARPTKNLTLYIQTVGRVLRSSRGKDKAIIIDHTGAVRRHGFIDDKVPWSLKGKDISKEKRQVDRILKKPMEIVCTRCQMIFSGSRECPGCGHTLVLPTEKIPIHEAELRRVVKPAIKYSPAEKIDFHGQLLTYANIHGYADGWASHKYNDKFGEFPSHRRVVPLTALMPEVLGFIKSRNIAYHKSRRRGRRS